MFISDDLVYIQMHKTGCTHIAALLGKLVEGQLIGKHNAASEGLIRSNRFFISSIRNPWDWYVSLWTYGVGGNGALRDNLTNRRIHDSIRLMRKYPRTGLKAAIREISKPTRQFRELYDNEENVLSFRKWLALILDPSCSRSLGEGYSDTAIKEICGFMSYRYLYLCCQNPRQLRGRNQFAGIKDVREFDIENCYINFFIRQESLEKDFCKALEKVMPLGESTKNQIHSARKVNQSRRPLPVSDYYTEDLIELVGRREKLLIDKFRYLPPEPIR
ncbi:hypothetical protein [Parahaliea mediterranea]|uniref:Sulfotransferase family protein n=1 Tax=Parahaliea mediterranea TaxID=651086 RepID=A0A939DGE1_9GAMM|nr:hypothetical protein [Parahaliea mediterranea]MBN7797734.1 hypothetical protein [Parahaliea mediterranea]